MATGNKKKKYAEMTVEQLREALRQPANAKDAEQIAKRLREKREEDLTSRAEAIKAPPPKPAAPAAKDSDDPKKRCFIATACYGDIDHPDVDVFRAWRDARLQATPCGRAFIRAYYAVSPPLASAIARLPRLARLIRSIFLEPLARRLRA